jgi:protein-S-isoprenylcysteine O-methyltransferase Ste14
MHTSCRPHSCVRWFDPILIATLVIGSYAALRSSSMTNVELALMLVGMVLVPMGLIEIAQGPWRGTPRPAIPALLTFRRAAIKWLGVMLGLAGVLLLWAALPEYSHASFRPLFEAMPLVLPGLPVAAAMLIGFTEWRLGPIEDESWQLGLLALGRWRQIDWPVLRAGLFAWLVKGFFLPLNFTALVGLLGQFRQAEGQILIASWPQAEFIIDKMIFAMLIAAITPGYLFSSRLLGTEIRKVEQSWFGWAVTLSCYPPLLSGVFDQWFNYHPYVTRPPWLAPWAIVSDSLPALSYAAGGLILALELIHYWGESIFSLRSSNLTNRGIITNGAYRFCKHPVYLAKCIAWFVIWLPPFEGGTVLGGARLTLLWACVCGIYMLRGWVEERLLSDDPDYVAYALWIDRHGLFAWAGRAVPALSFHWRLERWRKRSTRSDVPVLNSPAMRGEPVS